MLTVKQLQEAGNPLHLQALFLTDGCKSHLDLGSNDGRTLRGLDANIITAVELFEPSLALLRKQGVRDAPQRDIREYVDACPVYGLQFDRVTAFDIIEHLPRADGEKLLDQIEQLALREIVIFMPIETPELCATARWQAYREEGLALHPHAQRELQDHLSQWSPEDFTKRGYITLNLPNFHYPGFGAFFAAKYRDPADATAVMARLQEFARQNTPPQPQAWGHLGAGSGVQQALFVNGSDRMFLGDGVSIGYGARLECIKAYGGVEHSPTLVIGDGTTAEMFLHIGCADRVVISRDCMLAGHVTIMDHDHGTATDRPLHGQPLTVAPVKIGDGVFVGEGVTICKGVTIGDHAVIGAGAVVVADVPAYHIATGVPAVARGSRYNEPHIPLVSIVIPTIDRDNARTQACIDSIKLRTFDCSYELLVIEDKKREGFADTCNRGLAAAKGDYALLLNDDTEPGPGWLSRMLGVFEYFPEVGLVGPCSDNVSGPQCREPVPGPISQEVQRLVGFSLLIRRAVIDKIGGLDEAFTSGMFTDDDYTLRALAAGFKARIALDAFVRHDFGASYQEAGIGLADAMQAGWAVFARKWGAEATPGGYRIPGPVTWDKARCYVPLLKEIDHVAV